MHLPATGQNGEVFSPPVPRIFLSRGKLRADVRFLHPARVFLKNCDVVVFGADGEVLGLAASEAYHRAEEALAPVEVIRVGATEAIREVMPRGQLFFQIKQFRFKKATGSHRAEVPIAIRERELQILPVDPPVRMWLSEAQLHVQLAEIVAWSGR